MGRFRGKKGRVSWVLLLLAAILAVGREWGGWHWVEDVLRPGEAVEESLGEHRAVPEQAPGWKVWEGARWLPQSRQDGDSFWIRTPEGREVEVRLYFVDAPESAFKRYRNGQDNGKRLADQGRYFGGLDREETTAVGKEAASVVRQWLRGQPLRVLTREKKVYGSARLYALVAVKQKGEWRYLHELLVDRGLGRLHTEGVDLPGGISRREQEAALRQREQRAREAGRGGWGF